MIEFSLFVLAEMSPEEVGRMTGRLVFGLMILAGLAKCISIARRPQTSALCVHSLSMVLVLMLVSVASEFVQKSPLITVLFAIVYLVSLLIALVLGIVGLVEYRRHGETYSQGKGQAIWGIVLSCVYLLIMLGTVVHTAIERDNLTAELASADVDVNGRTQVEEALNYRFTPRGEGWVAVPPKTLNPAATTTYMRRDPQGWFMIIAERVGVETSLDTESFTALAKANMQAGAKNVEFGRERDESINGLTGTRFEADAVVVGQNMSYSSWVFAQNGFAYQLMAFSKREDKGRLSNFARQMSRGFELIDDQRIAYAVGTEAVENLRANCWGYEIDLSSDPGWVLVDSDQTQTSVADVSAAKYVDGQMVQLFVVPLVLPDDKVKIENLLAGMMTGAFDFDDVDRQAGRVKRVEGLEWDAAESYGVEQGSSGQFGYCMRVLKQGDRACLLAGIWAPEFSAADSLVKDVIERARLFSPTGVVPNLSEERRAALGLVQNEIGIAEYSDGRFDVAASFFAKALDYRVEWPILVNLIGCYSDRGQTTEAMEILERHSAQFADTDQYKVLRAQLLLLSEQYQQSMDAYAELYEGGFSDNDEIVNYLSAVVELEAYDQAIELLEKYSARNPSARLQRWQAVMHSRKGDHEAAVSQLLTLAETNKDDIDTQYALGETYELAGRYNEALALTELLLEDYPSDYNVLLLKARNEFQLKWYAKAQASFREVLEQHPTNEEATQYLQTLSGLLGQGDQSLITDPIEAVAIPPQVQARLGKAATRPLTETEQEYDAVDLYQVFGIAYEPGVSRRITQYRKCRVLRSAGVDRLSTLSKTFDPLSERLYVNRLAVYDTDGELIAEGSPKDYYVMDDSASNMAIQDQEVSIPVPSLKPGYTVEVVITTEQQSEPEEFGFEQKFIISTNPLRYGTVFFAGDLSQVRHVASGLRAETFGSELQVWSVEKPIIYKWETQQAAIEKFVPQVQISDVGTTWGEIGREYLGRIESKLDLDEQTRALANKQTAEFSDRQAKIEALAGYVQRECTYKAIEFGLRSQVPHTAALVHKNGYGDCKDHSVLLMQLLRGIGIEAQLVLVKSSGPLEESLPALDQFDHMIVYVPPSGEGDESGQFIDCTEKYTKPFVPHLRGLEDKQVLVLDHAKPTLKRTPGYDQLFGSIQVNRVVALDSQTETDHPGVTVNETLRINSYCAGSFRGFLEAYNAHDRRTAVRDLLSSVEKIRLRNLEIENFDQPNQDLVLHLKYDIPKAFNLFRAGEQSQSLVGTIPSIWEQYMFDVDFDDTRVTPFEFSMPLRVRARTEVQLPSGYELSNAEEFTVQDQSKFLLWASRAKQSNGKLIFDSVVQRGKGFYGPQDFSDYHESSQETVAALRRRIRLSRQGVPAR